MIVKVHTHDTTSLSKRPPHKSSTALFHVDSSITTFAGPPGHFFTCECRTDSCVGASPPPAGRLMCWCGGRVFSPRSPHRPPRSRHSAENTNRICSPCPPGPTLKQLLHVLP